MCRLAWFYSALGWGLKFSSVFGPLPSASLSHFLLNFPGFSGILLIKSLALQTNDALPGWSVASSISSSLWCFEQFVDCALSTSNIFHLVIISTFLGRIQYTHLLHAQDLGFMEAGFKCRLMSYCLMLDM